MESPLVQSVDDGSFRPEVLETALPVLVDIGAEWCPPCRALEPAVEAAARAYAGRLKVVTLDADKSPATAVQYGVRAMPTIILLRGGREVARHVGSMPRARLLEWLAPHV